MFEELSCHRRPGTGLFEIYRRRRPGKREERYRREIRRRCLPFEYTAKVTKQAERERLLSKERANEPHDDTLGSRFVGGSHYFLVLGIVL